MGNLKVIISWRNATGKGLESCFLVFRASLMDLPSDLPYSLHCIGYNCNIVLACCILFVIQYVIHSTTIGGNDRSYPKGSNNIWYYIFWSCGCPLGPLLEFWLLGSITWRRGKVSVNDRQLCHFIKLSHSEFWRASLFIQKGQWKQAEI